MIDRIIEFPESARVDRIIHKKRIYEKAKASTRLQRQFVEQVGQIRWQYKLAPRTINLPETNIVKEIQVIEVESKGGKVSDDVFVAIDKTIPSPIIFIIRLENKIKYKACYKRPSLADRSKWVTSSYFSSSWMEMDTNSAKLPVSTSLESLYGKMLLGLVPVQSRPNEPTEVTIERADQFKKLQQDEVRLTKQLEREKQFNRKVEINADLRQVQQELQAILV